MSEENILAKLAEVLCRDCPLSEKTIEIWFENLDREAKDELLGHMCKNYHNHRLWRDMDIVGSLSIRCDKDYCEAILKIARLIAVDKKIKFDDLLE